MGLPSAGYSGDPSHLTKCGISRRRETFKTWPDRPSKYFSERQWAERFLDGEILFRSLSYFCDYQDNEGGDRNEALFRLLPGSFRQQTGNSPPFSAGVLRTSSLSDVPTFRRTQWLGQFRKRLNNRGCIGCRKTPRHYLEPRKPLADISCEIIWAA